MKMLKFVFVVVLCVGAHTLQTSRAELTHSLTETPTTADGLMSHPAPERRRVTRGSRGAKHKENAYEPRPPVDPEGYFTTPRVFNGSLLVHNPLYPLRGGSYGAYGVLLLALVLFGVGAVANLALTCAVWHNRYLHNTRNCVLGSLALWDLGVVFLCLPVVTLQHLTKRRLGGELSCRLVPFIQVMALAVNTFSLCALSVQGFQTLTPPPRPHAPESFASVLSKLSVIWLGSLLLSGPELSAWRLETELSHSSRLPVDVCKLLPPATPHSPGWLHPLVVTYHQSRMWWTFGCFFCLPLIFSFSCQLLGSQLSESPAPSSSCTSSPPSPSPRRLVLMLTVVYGTFCLPEHAWNIGLAYAGAQVGGATRAALDLAGQFLMFGRASATPVLVLSACGALGRSFVDCCCCCCEECRPERRPPSPSASPSASQGRKRMMMMRAELDQRMKEHSGGGAVGTPC